MSNEAVLNIYDSGKVNSKTGKTYKNITLKTYLNQVTGEVKQGLKDKEYIIVQKVFEKGYEIDKGDYKSYSCLARYGDEEVSFFLNEKQHTDYEQAGGVDDFVKIEAESYTFKRGGKETVALGFKFSLVE